LPELVITGLAEIVVVAAAAVAAVVVNDSWYSDVNMSSVSEASTIEPIIIRIVYTLSHKKWCHFYFGSNFVDVTDY